jgi:hypothetical protein
MTSSGLTAGRSDLDCYDWKLRWAPEGTFMHTFQAAPKDTRQVIALVCEDGITAYQCVEG